MEKNLDEVKNKKTKNSLYSFQLNNLKIIKQIKEIPVDILMLKNKYILIINEQNKIQIYDNNFELLLRKSITASSNHIIFCKYFPSLSKDENDFLYLFTIKEVIIYEILFINKKGLNNNDNIMLYFIQKIESISDVIEFQQNNNSIFFINNNDSEYLLHEYKKEKEKNNKKTSLIFNKKVIKNISGKIFRKLYLINSEKFIVASYTLKIKRDNNYIIEGINKMSFFDSYNFKEGKSYDLKISPLYDSITNYKNNYIIISYFNTINNDSINSLNLKKEKDIYNFEDKTYIKLFHNFSHYEKVFEVDDYDIFYGYIDKYEVHYDYESYESKYYSYDIIKHYIGIFDIRTEELVTIYDFDIVKRMYNINNNLLFLFEKIKNNIKIDQISNERLYHHYFNEIPIKENDLATHYKRGNYLSFVNIDDGFILSKESFIDNDITCFIQISNECLVIGSSKRGIIIYK
jgi:hypothetical protein